MPRAFAAYVFSAAICFASTAQGDDPCPMGASAPPCAAEPDLERLELEDALIWPSIENHEGFVKEMRPTIPAGEMPVAVYKGMYDVALDSPGEKNDSLRKLLPYRNQVAGLSLGFEEFDDSAAELLGKFPKLDAVFLFSTTIGDDGLRRIARVPNLRWLTVYADEAAEISDEGISAFRDARALEYLRLENLDTEHVLLKGGFAAMREFHIENSNCRSISVEGGKALGIVNIDADGLKRFKLTGSPHLRELKILSHTQEFEESLDLEVGDVPALKSLYLFANVKREDLKAFSTARGLESAVIQRASRPLPAAALAEVAAWPELRSLQVGHLLEELSAETLRPLLNCKRLEVLGLELCGVKDEAVEVIAELRNLRHIDLSSNEISDAAVEKLSSLERLEELRLEGMRRLLTPACRTWPSCLIFCEST